MIHRILLYFGLSIVSLDLVARALASDILRTHDVTLLDTHGTVQELRRRYAMVATETGLPMHAQGRVAEMAWRYVAAAQAQPQADANRREFSFYG